jgi:hypothetical protein
LGFCTPLILSVRPNQNPIALFLTIEPCIVEVCGGTANSAFSSQDMYVFVRDRTHGSLLPLGSRTQYGDLLRGRCKSR